MTIQFTQLTTDGYLFERGYTYASVQWNKEVTELFGSRIPPDLKKHNRLVYSRSSKGPTRGNPSRCGAISEESDCVARPRRASTSAVRLVLRLLSVGVAPE